MHSRTNRLGNLIMSVEISVGPPVLTINNGNTFMVTELSGEIAALRLQISEVEKRMMHWSLATIVAISSVVVGVVKIWP